MNALVDQITRLYEIDQKSGAPAVEPGDIPIHYESITPQWLTHILCPNLPDARVVAYRLDEKDDGTANRRRIFIEYNDAGQAAGLPSSVFCKASQDLLNRINLGVCGSVHSEVTFYNRIRPLIDLEMPIAYHAAYDPQSFNSIIVLKDIGDEVEFCRHWTDITFDRAVSQVKLLAGFHSKFQENSELNGRTLGLVTWPEYFADCAKNGVEEYSNKGFRTAEPVIPPRLFARYAEIWPATQKSVDIHVGMPATLVHGDCHLKQWYIRGESQMGLGDWQGCSFGHWARDYSYAMTTSLTIENRRAWERDLLEIYLAEMARLGAAVPSFDEAFLYYRQNLLSALCWWTVTLTPSPGMPAMQPEDTTLEFISRMAAAIDDLDALDALR